MSQPTPPEGTDLPEVTDSMEEQFFVTGLATRLFRSPLDQLEMDIRQCLEQAGRLYSAGQVYFCIFPDKPAVENTVYEWVAPGIPAGADLLRVTSPATRPRLMAGLGLDQHFFHDPDQPDDPDPRPVLIIPVHSHQRLTALIGLGAGTDGKGWPESVVPSLRLLGQTLFAVHDNRRLSRQLTRLSHHDPLTNLPNRTLMKDRLRRALARNRRENWRLVLLVLDMDDFKLANDSLGQAGGDLLLNEIAGRLREVTGEYDTVARLGGDEFVVIIENARPGQAESIARRILRRLSEPMEIDGRTMVLHPSIGITDSLGDDQDADQLLQNADLAMYAAKAGGKNRYEYFDSSMSMGSDSDLALRYQLGEAIEKHQLSLLFQPRVCLRSRRTEGAEALIRWKHPKRGLLRPEEFVRFAERSELICALDHWVLQEAASQCRQWPDADRGFVLSVNLSARELHDASRLDRLIRAISDNPMPPDRLELELTESVLIENVSQIGENLVTLKRSLPGLRIAIDDFGSGYSSLNYLRRLPIDTLKIDQAFIHDLGPAHPRALAIARAIVELGHGLGLQVVAEGVSSEEQATCLQELGCDQGQGYHFSSPIDTQAFAQRLERERHTPEDSTP